MSEHRGSCLCGAVRYTVNGELRGVTVCHCTQCRKSSGHQWASAGAKWSELVFDRGAEAVAWFASSDFARRGFCGRCGSSLFYKPNSRDYVAILAGSFDTPTGLGIAGHIYVEDAGDYYVIPDDAPHHRGPLRRG